MQKRYVFSMRMTIFPVNILSGAYCRLASNLQIENRKEPGN